MLRALGREIRRAVIGLVAAAVAICGLIAVWTWMGDQLVAQIGGM